MDRLIKMERDRLEKLEGQARKIGGTGSKNRRDRLEK